MYDFDRKGINIYYYDNGELIERKSAVNQAHFDLLMETELETKVVLEVSTIGDVRFSAFGAKVSSFGWTDIIEFHYMLAKGFDKVKIPNMRHTPWHKKKEYIDQIKGLKPTFMILNDKKYDVYLLSQWYDLLWVKYLNSHPELVEYLRLFDDYNDVFKGKSVNCQEYSIRKYIREGKDAMLKDCSELLKLMGG